MSVNEIELAGRLAGAGISVAPVATDGSKTPPLGVRWKHLQQQIATSSEIRHLFQGRVGIATLGGAVSGNLETLDVDAPKLVEKFETLVREIAPGLIERLNKTRTPRRNDAGQCGIHYRYRVTTAVAGNTKLAETEPRPQFNADGSPQIDKRTGKQKLAPETLIETRGEGGYAIAPGSPAECHPSGRLYEHVAGPSLFNLPVISEDDHQTLWLAARSFNQNLAHRDPESIGSVVGNGISPGSDFNERATWEEILEPDGWQKVHARGEIAYWRRPGKEGRGWSATTGTRSVAGNDLLCVFSSNAYPFEGAANGKPCSSYSKFAAYALLNHGGDFQAAAKELNQQGYGSRCKGGGTAASGESQQAAHVVGDLTLVAKATRRTSAKLTVTVELHRDGQAIDRLKLSDSAYSRRDVAKAIRSRIKAVAAVTLAEIDEVLGAILLSASEQPPPRLEGDTAREIIRSRVVEECDFRYSDGGKAYSEARGELLSKAVFVERYTNNRVLDLIATASDAPRDEDGSVNRGQLVQMLDRELKLLWGDLLNSLKPIEQAEIEHDSPAAEVFRQRHVEVWTKPANMCITRHQTGPGSGESVQMASRSSLASAVQRRRFHIESSGMFIDRWYQVQEGYSAWFREYRKDGQVVVALAMKAELPQQIGVTIPEAANQKRLRTIGEKLGAYDPIPPVKDRATGGVRLIVLSPGVAAQILSVPVSPEEESDESSTASDTSVTNPKPSVTERPRPIVTGRNRASDTSDEDYSSLEENFATAGLASDTSDEGYSSLRDILHPDLGGESHARG